uniref:Uncharacterized protein n=1 Tax=Tanacetum cinerariifolium TaxID=118510 RepID=A0A6L2J2L1_TANCI|nr:hypothetical protein [Tanacetum cinerariifolium]
MFCNSQTSLKKYSRCTRLLHDPFISSNVGPVNNSRVRVSTLSRFITNAEKSSEVSISSLNESRELSFRSKLLIQGIDIARIKRKEPKTSNNGHKNGKTVYGVSEAETCMHTPAPGESEAQNGLPDSILLRTASAGSTQVSLIPYPTSPIPRHLASASKVLTNP